MAFLVGRASRELFGPLIGYGVLAFLFFANAHCWTHSYFGYTTDPIQFIWFLNWWPFAIAHHLNPFICKYVWFPQGFNFTWATSVPLLSLLFWPVTAWGGPVLSYNILTLMAPMLAAWTAYLLCRELTGDWRAAFIAGYLFGFSAPELNELVAELNLDMIFLVPLAVLLCVRRVRGRIGRKSFIAAIGCVLLAQLGISTEVLATLCLFGALVWGVFLAMAPAEDRPGFWMLAVDMTLAAPLVILCAAPFLRYLVLGYSDTPKVINSPVFGSADIVQFIMPSLPARFGWPMLQALAHGFSGFAPGLSASFGIPLVLIMAWYFTSQISRTYVKALLIVTGLFVIFSLGPCLHWNGRLTNILLPWNMFLQLPLIRSVLPGRFTIYISLCASVAAACFLAAAKPGSMRGWRCALAGLACVALVPKTPLVTSSPWQVQPIFVPLPSLEWSPWPQQPFFTPAHVKQALGVNPNVLLLPFPSWGPGMGWQLDAGLGFTQSGGYVGFDPVSVRQWHDLLMSLDLGTPQADFAAALTAYCKTHGVDFVLEGPGTPPALVSAISTLNWPQHVDDGVQIVKVPAA